MPLRVLIASDQCGNWYVRRIKDVIHDQYSDEKLYRCDQPIGRRFRTLDAASNAARKAIKQERDRVSR